VRRVFLVVTALAALYLYSYCLIFCIGYALAQPHPTWWESMFISHSHAALAWMVFCHSLAILIVSLPFAYLIQRVYGRYGPLIALAMTFTLFVAFALPALIGSFGPSPTRHKVVTIFDQIKLLAILPVLVWAFSKLPSNQRLERPVTPRNHAP
jgi:MFS family permease